MSAAYDSQNASLVTSEERPVCPISLEALGGEESIVGLTVDGHIFEYSAIKEWLDKEDRSPLTGLILEKKRILNLTKQKTYIEEFLRARPGESCTSKPQDPEDPVKAYQALLNSVAKSARELEIVTKRHEALLLLTQEAEAKAHQYQLSQLVVQYLSDLGQRCGERIEAKKRVIVGAWLRLSELRWRLHIETITWRDASLLLARRSEKKKQRDLDRVLLNACQKHSAYESTALVEKILAKRACPHPLTCEAGEFTALEVACKSGDVALVRLLLGRAEPDAFIRPRKPGTTLAPLMIFCSSPNTTCSGPCGLEGLFGKPMHYFFDIGLDILAQRAESHFAFKFNLKRGGWEMKVELTCPDVIGLLTLKDAAWELESCWPDSSNRNRFHLLSSKCASLVRVAFGDYVVQVFEPSVFCLASLLLSLEVLKLNSGACKREDLPKQTYDILDVRNIHWSIHEAPCWHFAFFVILLGLPAGLELEKSRTMKVRLQKTLESRPSDAQYLTISCESMSSDPAFKLRLKACPWPFISIIMTGRVAENLFTEAQARGPPFCVLERPSCDLQITNKNDRAKTLQLRDMSPDCLPLVLFQRAFYPLQASLLEKPIIYQEITPEDVRCMSLGSHRHGHCDYIYAPLQSDSFFTVQREQVYSLLPFLECTGNKDRSWSYQPELLLSPFQSILTVFVPLPCTDSEHYQLRMRFREACPLCLLLLGDAVPGSLREVYDVLEYFEGEDTKCFTRPNVEMEFVLVPDKFHAGEPLKIVETVQDGSRIGKPFMDKASFSLLDFCSIGGHKGWSALEERIANEQLRVLEKCDFDIPKNGQVNKVRRNVRATVERSRKNLTTMIENFYSIYLKKPIRRLPACGLASARRS